MTALIIIWLLLNIAGGVTYISDWIHSHLPDWLIFILFLPLFIVIMLSIVIEMVLVKIGLRKKDG